MEYNLPKDIARVSTFIQSNNKMQKYEQKSDYEILQTTTCSQTNILYI